MANNNKEKYFLDSILYKAPSISDPKEYISSIESSGLPKIDYIMNKYRASTIEYVVENPPPKLVVTNDIKKNSINNSNNNNNNKTSPPKDNINSPKLNSINNNNNNISNNTNNNNNNNSQSTKPRSKSCPPLKDLPCNHCKKMVSIDGLQPCDRCGNGCYCSDDCQYANWVIHKKKCKNLGMVIKMKRCYSL